MMARTLRKIVKIDEEKCNGCGVCVPACVEGALQIIDGKARLVSEKYCDGLGACLGECPQGAISIEEREAMEFDEEASITCSRRNASQRELPCDCPSAAVRQFETKEPAGNTLGVTVYHQSMLKHRPVQLALIPQAAPFLQGADIILAADCVPFAYAGFHHDFLKDHALLVACPKLDNFQAHQRKLTDIFSHSDIRSLTVVHMEVPCCSGLVHMAKHAIRLNGKEIPFKEQTIGIGGDIKS